MKDRVLLLAAAMLAMMQLQGQQTSTSIEVPQGNRELMHLKGDGVQIYTCTDDKKWGPAVPDAKLLDSNGKLVGTHSKGPTWALNDGGTVQGVKQAGEPSPDKKRKSVDWLLLRAKEGTGTCTLGKVTFIQRTETKGGLPNPKGCKVAGKIAKVHYTATYTFYVPN